MRARHIPAVVALALSCALFAISCVQNPKSPPETDLGEAQSSNGTEPVGEAQQPVGSKVWKGQGAPDFFDEAPSFNETALPRYRGNEDKLGRGVLEPDELPPSRWAPEPETDTRLRTVTGVTLDVEYRLPTHYHLGPNGTVEPDNRMRVIITLPDGRTREAVASVICMLSTGGHPSSSRCQEWSSLLTKVGGGVGAGSTAVLIGIGTTLAAGGLTAASAAAVAVAATPEGWVVLGLSAFAVYEGSGLGEGLMDAWVKGGCQLPPQWLQVHDFQYSWPRDFDFGFKGGWQVPHYIDPWLDGVGNGVGSGGDVLRNPSPDWSPGTGTPRVGEPPAQDFSDVAPFAVPREPGHEGDVS